MSLMPLPDLILLPLIENALREDLGRAGDITSEAIVPLDEKWKSALNARQAGTLAGIDLARLAFTTTDPSLLFVPFKKDGDQIAPGDCLAKIEGRARSILAGERVALNFLSHLSGIASETHKLVEAVRPHKARICCTRKTTPGLRAVEKYAVRAGGGSNHRFGLDDAMMIKDNHIAIAGGIGMALQSARKAAGHLVKVALEVDNLAQLDEALALLGTYPMDSVLLDNMDIDTLAKAVKRVAGRVTTEASGGITLQTIADIAATGVDIISVGFITHSAPILDIGLDVS